MEPDNKMLKKNKRNPSITFTCILDTEVHRDDEESQNADKRPIDEEESFKEDSLVTVKKTKPPENQFNMIIPRRFRKKKNKQRESKTSKESTPLEFPRKRRASTNMVKNVVKLTDLVKLFYEKVSYNNTFREPINFNPLDNQNVEDSQNYLCNFQKITIPKAADNIITVIKILYNILYLFAFPLSLIFDQVSYSEPMIILKSLAIMLCILDILQILQNSSPSHQPTYSSAEEIKTMVSRKKRSLVVQMLLITCAVLSLILTEYRTVCSSLIFGLMIINIKRYQEESLYKLQSQFFTATHYEKYWDIIKMMALNLLVCHLLACVLISITSFKLPQNWMTKAGIFNAPWYEKYVWSYYFGITIILTIGFGDIHAANYIEAFFIITISFFAVVFFGYNINYIGNRINSIREEQFEKNDKLKVFGSLAKKTQVPEELKTEITNFIIQESQIKKVSNFAQQKKLLQELPCALRSSFLQQTNKQLFNNLLQLITFSKKTIQALSQNIETKICHPEQIIKKARSAPRLMILQSGEIGYSARVKGSSKLNGIVLEHVSSKNEKQSKLICVDILSNKPLNYDIKSLSYSVIYYMDKETFEKVLRSCHEDFEVYRQILDRCNYKLNQFGLTLCKFCKNKKHTLFDCPRLHFTPFRHIIPLQYYKKKPIEKQERRVVIRNKKKNHFEHMQKNRWSKQNVSFDSEASIQVEDLADINPHIFRKRQGRVNPVCHPHLQNFKKKKNSSIASYIHTTEVVSQLREQLKKISLNKEEKSSEFLFTLWGNCDSDDAHNYNYYFPQNNPNKLATKEFKATLQNLMKSNKKKMFKSGTDMDWALHTC